MLNLVDDLEKIKIIDRALSGMTLDEVKLAFGMDSTVDKLQGVVTAQGPLLKLISELQITQSESMSIRSECNMLKADIQTLIRCLNKGMGDTTVAVEFNNLKQRHGIY